MKNALLGGALGAALLLSTNMVLAQAVYEITPQQERTVYTNIYGQRVVSETTPQFEYTVGAVVPSEVQIYEMPAGAEYAPVQQYRYVTAGSRVVLIEPATRRVVRVIQAPNEVQRDKVQQ